MKTSFYSMFLVSEKMLYLGLANFLFSIHVYGFMTNNTTSGTGIEGTNNHSGAQMVLWCLMPLSAASR
jgi:hypothetical protein